MTRLFLCIYCAGLLWWSPQLAAAELTDPDERFFENRIRPVLVQHCYECHSAGAKNLRGGLLLDRRVGLTMGGDTGPAVVPGDPDESLIIQAIRYESLEMPPQGKLPDHVVADFTRWVRMGAPDPRVSAAIKKKAREIDLDEGRKFWSFRPVQRVELPRAHDGLWSSQPVDRFILSRLEADQLAPPNAADRLSLVRRAYFSLIGLPPTPEQIQALARDQSPDAWERLLDRLLASPDFGERWGRHWLDVARFAESSGGGRSLMFPNAWRFRDYVIRSFNDDKPFDRFAQEQMAGDLLPHKVELPKLQDQLTATGFMALGAINYELQDKELLRMEVIDEQIDTIGRAFLGMTIGCARCHDHKFDPIPTTDYYALAGILRSTQSLVPGNVSNYVERPLPLDGPLEQELRQYEEKVAAIQQHIDSAKKQLASLIPLVASSSETSAERDEPSRSSNLSKQIKSTSAEVKRLETELQRLRRTGPPSRPLVMSVREHEQIGDYHVCIRGDAHNLGPQVPRGVLRVTRPTDEEFTIPSGASGRLELARWLTCSENPLTSRVIVNRIWHYLFGEGIVRTPDNFGLTGQAPTHPELLDQLAIRFMEDGWSTKRTIRRLMLSSTFRSSSDIDKSTLKADPGNRLFSRFNRRRLESESMRDAMLAISGQLDRAAGGLTIRKITQYDLDYEFDTVRRSVYVPCFRNSRLDLFDVFDAANPNITSGRRTVSTLPTQALYMMNSSFVIEQARHTAAVLMANFQLTDEQRIDRAYLMTLGRPPTADELQLTLDYLTEFAAGDGVDAWAGVFHLLLASVEFRYLN